MPFSDYTGPLNDAVLAHLSDGAFTYKPKLGPTSALVGILETGVEVEGLPPGDSSTYARLWVKGAAFATPAVAGDEIISGTAIYKIVRPEADAGGGVWLLLRYHKEVV